MAKALLLLLVLTGVMIEDDIPTQDQTLQMCDEKEMTYTGDSHGNQTVRYRLFVPEPIEKGKRYPLVLWLHGYGSEIDSDNCSQTKHAWFMFWKGCEKSHYPYFVLFPQCPKENPGWYHADNPQDQMATVALAIITQTEKEYPIDRDRIYLWGISGGATSALQMVKENPDRFAAVSVAGTDGCPSAYWPEMVNTPLWAFLGTDDPMCTIEIIQETVDGIQGFGGIAELTLFDNVGHDPWRNALQYSGAVDWMLHQKRGSASSWCYPGRPSKWEVLTALDDAKIPLSITIAVFVLTLLTIVYQLHKMKITSVNTQKDKS